MCAPTKDLVKIALIAGVAYATGGISLGTTAATTATTATTAASTAATVGTTTTSSGIFSTLASYAKTAAPWVGAVGSVVSGYMQSNMLQSKANFVDYSILVDEDASGLRKAQRQRQMRLTIEAQKAKYGLTGVTLEGTPTDILAETNAKFAEDQFIDNYNTAQKIYSKQIGAEQYRTEASSAMLGGIVNAATVIGTRGFTPQTTKGIPGRTPGATGDPF